MIFVPMCFKMRFKNWHIIILITKKSQEQNNCILCKGYVPEGFEQHMQNSKLIFPQEETHSSEAQICITTVHLYQHSISFLSGISSVYRVLIPK